MFKTTVFKITPNEVILTMQLEAVATNCLKCVKQHLLTWRKLELQRFALIAMIGF